MFKAITGILAWRKVNEAVLKLVWMALKQINKCTNRNIRVLWVRQLKSNPITPYILTTGMTKTDRHKVVQAVVKTTQKSFGPDAYISRGTATAALGRQNIPRDHAFIMYTGEGYKVMRGQIDSSPTAMDAKMTFIEAKDKLTESVLRLMQVTGLSEITKEVEQMIVESSSAADEQGMKTRSQTRKEAQEMIDRVSNGAAMRDSNGEHRNEDADNANNGQSSTKDTSSAITDSLKSREPQQSQQLNNVEQVQSISGKEDQNINEENRMKDRATTGIRVKPKLRAITMDIMDQTAEGMARQFKKEIEDFQAKMLAEVRKEGMMVETQRFVPPAGFVPKRLSRAQFKRVSEAFARKEGDIRAKQFRYLNLMNLIQTKFREREETRTPNVQQVVHRKVCDGNLAAAFRIVMGEMRKTRMGATQEDIETLFPMNENGEWEGLKYPRAQRTITDERIDTLIGRLPRDRAPGRSRITYGHLKRLNANERTTKQLHELIKHIYSYPDKVPQDFYTAELTMIPKGNGGKRPIALQESIVKVIHKHIAAIITSHAMGNEDFSGTQFCIGNPEGTAEAAAKIYQELSKDRPCFVASLDLSNAFNTIDQQCIITGLEHLNVPEEVREYVYHYLRTYAIHCVCDGYELTRRTHRGVPQGCPAAMALFSVGLFQTLREVIEERKVKLVCYADDVVVMGESREATEQAITEIERRLVLSQPRLNPEKTKRITNRETMDGYTSWGQAKWQHLGIPISSNQEHILECLEKIKNEQLRAMEAVWGEDVMSHHESYLLQRTCVQPKSQYALRAIMPSISEGFLQKWDKEIDDRYPGYIQKIPREYRMQRIAKGGMQLVPPSVVREAASKAFKASNDFEQLDGETKGRIEATTPITKEDSLQSLITKHLRWYSLQLIQGLERNSGGSRTRHKAYEQPTKLLGQGDNTIKEGRPIVTTEQDSAWLSRLPNKPSDVLDTLGFKIAITMRYNLKWEKDEELNKIFCANHKNASNTEGAKDLGCRLSLSHALGCKINADGRIGTRHDAIVRIVGKALAAKGINVNIEKPFHYTDGDEKRESSHRPDAWYVEGAHVNIFDVTVGAFKDSRDKEAWVTSRKSKLGQYRELTSKLKDDVTVNIVQFDVAGRVGPETAAIMDKIGVKRHVLTNIQLMILSLNSWLCRNAIQRAAQARDDGRGIEARLWAERLVAEY